MTQTIEAVYDGTVLIPEEQLPFAPNTRLKLTIEPIAGERDTISFLTTARFLFLVGPSDWASSL